MFVQSGFVVHGEQEPFTQADAVASVQSVPLRHATQIFLDVSQKGVAPEQLVFFVHCTQALLVVLHADVEPEQFASLVH
jgi:hypothetical protein